ncbi:MAG: HEAT repeat domain-containing protein [Deltaproteobacteria bacterium]|jgi:HEAT repeat protein|nr:HEAT repeat domain-containing protein [Deltaproteobacteria bacterium]
MDEQQILSMLESDNPDDIREGAYEAGDAGLESALPLLVQKLSIPNPGLHEAIDLALRKIGGRPVIFAVIPMLRSEDAPVRNLAMDVLREVGRNEVSMLSELLNDEDADIRIFGADIIGATGSALAVPLLSHSLLYDPEVNVRYQAAVSLGNLAYPEAAPALNKALKDDEWVRFAVIEALTKVKAESSVGALLMALDKSSELVAANIVEALGEMGYIKAAPMLIKRLPQSSGPLADKIVRAIVQLVGGKSLKLLDKNEYDTLLQYMFAALNNEDTQIQDAAIAGLSAAHEEKYFRAIFALLCGLDPDKDLERMQYIAETLAGMGYYPALEESLLGGDDKTRQLAVDILSHIDDPRAVSILKDNFGILPRDVQRSAINALASRCGHADVDFFVDVLDRVRDGSIIKSALYFLGKNMEVGLIDEKVWPFLLHDYQDVQEAALNAIMSVRAPGIRERLIAMTQDEAELKRRIAYYALRSYNDDADIVPYLAVGLRDDFPEVRRIAVESLGNGGLGLTPERIAYLASCLEDEDRDVRLASVDALGLCAGAEVERYLIRGLRDPDPWVRTRCVESLGRRHDQALAPELAKLLEDEQPLVVIKTIESLAELGGGASFKYLLPLMEHPDSEVQRVAAECIEKIRHIAEE